MFNVEAFFAEVNREIRLLAPFLLEAYNAAKTDARSEDGFVFYIFEGFRSSARQNQLYAQGRTAPGEIITNARAWQSFHQLGLAFDIAFKDGNGNWTWQGDFDKAAMFLKKHGFESLAPLERGHFQMTGGLRVGDAVKMSMQYGLPALWKYVAQATENQKQQ